MQTYYETVAQYKKDAEAYSQHIAYMKLIVAFICLNAGEIYEIDYSRLLVAIFLLSTFLNYREENLQATKPLARYRVGQEFRKAAENDDTAKIYLIMSRMGKMMIGDAGPDSGRAALHVAVNRGSMKAIKLLLIVDDNIRNSDVPSRPDIINMQDKLGNTPVHIALLNLISGKQKNFDVLITLLKSREEVKVQSGFLNGSISIPANSNINPLLENKVGKTIGALLSEVNLPKENLGFAIAANLLKKITEDKELGVSAENNSVVVYRK